MNSQPYDGPIMHPQTITVSLEEWLGMQRRLGFAEGLLTGWTFADADSLDHCRTVTRKFLEDAPHD